MKHILMIGTGGTIASGISDGGLAPALSLSQLLEFVPSVQKLCRVDCIQPFYLDSTNMGPAHWRQLISLLKENYDRFDGFVICHGTDTMAYTAAALSYFVQDAKKPIVLTGAQKPIDFDSTDSKVNLYDAFVCASSDTLHGVMIVFNGKIILGTRACKTRSKSYEAFSSINYPYLGVLLDGRLAQYIEPPYRETPTFYDSLNERISILKLFPGISCELVRYMANAGDALIIESFGVGGIPRYEGRDLLSVLSGAANEGKTIVMTTQVQNEGSNLGVYQVGSRALRCPHILEAFDMTTEAIFAKLMWILGQTADAADIRKLFYTRIANDIFC